MPKRKPVLKACQFQQRSGHVTVIPVLFNQYSAEDKPNVVLILGPSDHSNKQPHHVLVKKYELEMCPKDMDAPAWKNLKANYSYALKISTQTANAISDADWNGHMDGQG